MSITEKINQLKEVSKRIAEVKQTIGLCGISEDQAHLKCVQDFVAACVELKNTPSVLIHESAMHLSVSDDGGYKFVHCVIASN